MINKLNIDNIDVHIFSGDYTVPLPKGWYEHLARGVSYGTNSIVNVEFSEEHELFKKIYKVGYLKMKISEDNRGLYIGIDLSDNVKLAEELLVSSVSKIKGVFTVDLVIETLELTVEPLRLKNEYMYFKVIGVTE